MSIVIWSIAFAKSTAGPLLAPMMTPRLSVAVYASSISSERMPIVLLNGMAAIFCSYVLCRKRGYLGDGRPMMTPQAIGCRIRFVHFVG